MSLCPQPGQVEPARGRPRVARRAELDVLRGGADFECTFGDPDTSQTLVPAKLMCHQLLRKMQEDSYREEE